MKRPHLIRGACYCLWGKVPTLYLGIAPPDIEYPCDECGKERSRLHHFVAVEEPDRLDACRYKLGTECVYKVLTGVIPCPATSANYKIPDWYRSK